MKLVLKFVFALFAIMSLGVSSSALATPNCECNPTYEGYPFSNATYVAGILMCTYNRDITKTIAIGNSQVKNPMYPSPEGGWHQGGGGAVCNNGTDGNPQRCPVTYGTPGTSLCGDAEGSGLHGPVSDSLVKLETSKIQSNKK